MNFKLNEKIKSRINSKFNFIGAIQLKKLTGMGILLSILTLSTHAQAKMDVVCLKGSCLTQGWSGQAENGYWFELRCTENDCANKGWRTRDSKGNNVVTECLGAGCFKDGFKDSNFYNPREYAMNLCQSKDENSTPDCMKYGWTSQSGYRRSVTTCRSQNCATQGWMIQTDGQSDLIAFCKNGHCFENGWIVQP